MKTIICISLFAASVALGSAARAATSPYPQMLAEIPVSAHEYRSVVFSDTAEAVKLRRAYMILATGNHNYNGHRIGAMHAVEAAGKMLGMDLGGDLNDRRPQFLSDDKLRDARHLITEVLGSSEVKGQERVTKRLTEAINQIDDALSTQ